MGRVTENVEHSNGPDILLGRNVLAQHVQHFEVLPYTIHSWSSHSSQYHPVNITDNKPTEQASRWSSDSNNRFQYLTLKLDRPAVINAITFGKFHKMHVCNLKEFKIYGGMHPDRMIEMFHGGLRNDEFPETFVLKCDVRGVIFPCLYLKVVPVLAWGTSFNFSVWFVQLLGILNSRTVVEIEHNYRKFLQQQSLRLIMKFLREHQYIDNTSLALLQSQSGVVLEDPMLSVVYDALVHRGDMNEVSCVLQQAHDGHLFEEYIADSQYSAKWVRLQPPVIAHGPSPCMRGGHQMWIDMDLKYIFLFGGWNGETDLSDLWRFEMVPKKWVRICEDTRASGGPSPRSCHKVCHDEARKVMYTVGRYIDNEQRRRTELNADFYMYDYVNDKWTVLSMDTSITGGPSLIYDHQMSIDVQTQKIYVFGGRCITRNDVTKYSGLWMYSVRDGTWRELREDNDKPKLETSVRSRIGHSMVHDDINKRLYILSGQRSSECLTDFLMYDIDKDEMVELSNDILCDGGPDPSFTQRSTIDTQKQEMYILCGIARDREESQTQCNGLWVYEIHKSRWRNVKYQITTDVNSSVAPCPRYAHQFVYDKSTETHYLFGGNPALRDDIRFRLDDFWELKLRKPTSDAILHECMLLVMGHKFKELVRCCH